MVLDLKMPKRDGYGVLEWMRGKSPRPKVAVFTASALESDKNRVAELGADIYQHKSFRIETLNEFNQRLQSLCPHGTARP